MTWLIPYADLAAEYRDCQPAIDMAMQRCIANSTFINGPEVVEFEHDWADYTLEQDCAGVSSGTSALMLALSTLGIGPGDEVIVPTMSFISTAEVVSQLGARPVFVDIDQYHTMDIHKIPEAMSLRTRAIIFVDLYGQTLDIAGLHDVAEGVPLIRDAAQSAGSSYAGSTDERVHATCWSFYPGKNLGAMGDAGAVTGSVEVCERIRFLRDHGRREKYVHEAMGWNERLDGLQAAVLRAKLPMLDRWNQRRCQHAEIYHHRLANLGLGLPEANHVSTHVYNQFVITVDQRDALHSYLANLGTQCGIQFPLAMHQQPVYRGYRYHLPRAERLAATCLSLPVHAQLGFEQIHTVCDQIAEFISG